MAKQTPKVAVIGASGFAGAIAAELLHGHPSFELTKLTARSDVGHKLSDLYPHRRVPLELEELKPAVYEGLDAAVVAYPHGASAPAVA